MKKIPTRTVVKGRPPRETRMFRNEEAKTSSLAADLVEAATRIETIARVTPSDHSDYPKETETTRAGATATEEAAVVAEETAIGTETEIEEAAATAEDRAETAAAVAAIVVDMAIGMSAGAALMTETVVRTAAIAETTAAIIATIGAAIAGIVGTATIAMTAGTIIATTIEGETTSRRIRSTEIPRTTKKPYSNT